MSYLDSWTFDPHLSCFLSNTAGPFFVSLNVSLTRSDTMPLFHRRSSADEVAPQHTNGSAAAPKRTSTMFRRRRSVSPANTTTTTGSRASGSPGHRTLLHRHDQDPSIIAARERVLSAEAAEREADRALMQAKTAVKEAREHVKRLEREAAEE